MKLSVNNSFQNKVQVWVCNSNNYPENLLSEEQLKYISEQLEDGTAELKTPAISLFVFNPDEKTNEEYQKSLRNHRDSKIDTQSSKQRFRNRCNR